MCLDDDDDRNTIDLVAELLPQQPASQTTPPLNPGWFTAIALTDPDAINLFSPPDGTPVSRAGLLDRPTRTLAVVETDGVVGCGTTSTIHAFGGDHARTRLLDLIDRLPAVALPCRAAHQLSGKSLEQVEGVIAGHRLQMLHHR